jgi:hypothetical protein
VQEFKIGVAAAIPFFFIANGTEEFNKEPYAIMGGVFNDMEVHRKHLQ